MFVLLDAPGLVEEDYQRHALGHPYDKWKPIHGGPVHFVKSIAEGIDLSLLLEIHCELLIFCR